MTDKELMQQALKVLQEIADEVFSPYDNELGKVILALREWLAQPETVMAEYKFRTYAAYKTDGEMKIGVVPEQEPVATVESKTGNPDILMSWWHEPALPVGTKLYTTPPRREWVGLAEEDEIPWDGVDAKSFARAIEAKLKEKNA